MVTETLNARYALIWEKEQMFGHSLARQIIHKPTVTVWMILLPLLFVFYLQALQKYKTGLEQFMAGFLKTKKAALDLAFESVKAASPLDGIIKTYADELPHGLKANAALYRQHLDEVTFLAGHYRKLLAGKGDSYDDLLKNVYVSTGPYQAFLNTLADLENNVVASVLSAAPSEPTTTAAAAQMQKLTRQLRRQEVARVFS